MKILFRGKSIERFWRYGYLVRRGVDEIPYIVGCYSDAVSQVVPETVGQLAFEYEDGVRIFENDVVELSGEEPFEYGSCITGYDWKFRGVVKMIDAAWRVVEIGENSGPSFSEIIYTDVDIELIGNIFDSPFNSISLSPNFWRKNEH